MNQALKPRIYAPGDIVLEFGEDAQELFFLNAGNQITFFFIGLIGCRPGGH